MGVAALAVPETVRSPLMLTVSPKTASSSTKRSPFVVILSVVESPKVKSPLTARLPSTVKLFEKVLFPATVWLPVTRTAWPLRLLRSAFKVEISPSLLVTCDCKFVSALST